MSPYLASTKSVYDMVCIILSIKYIYMVISKMEDHNWLKHAFLFFFHYAIVVMDIYVSGNKQNQALSLFPRQLVND